MNRKYLSIYLLAMVLTACSKNDRLVESPIPDGEKKVVGSMPEKLENPYQWWAKDFPGDVKDSVKRLQDVELTVNGNYKTWGHLKINTTPSSPLVSTGLYVPVAEMITVEVPENVHGLKYQIGVYHCSLPETEPRKRYSQIVKTGELSPGKNEIFNYFGGHLYLCFKAPIADAFVVKVSGAVKSPDFILGQTDAQGWKKEIATTGVPWAEMICDRMILTMPVQDLRKVTDPEALMKFYQEFVVEDFNRYAGMTEDNDSHHAAPTFPWRYVVDKQLCAGFGHNGYPFVGDLSWAGGALNFGTMTAGDWGTFHELGHNYQTNTWKWGALGEVSNNLHVYHMMNRKFSIPHAREIEPESAIRNYVLRQDAAMETWNFDDLCKEKVFWGLVAMLQITHEYGWPFFAYVAREGRENGNLADDQDRRDFFARRASEYANADLTPFFDAWRIQLGTKTRKYIEQYPAVENKFWETFDRNKIGHFNESTPVKKDEPQSVEEDANRSEWEVTASSTRPNTIANLIDGTNTTFWQSNWAATNHAYPHWLQVDMKKEITFNYIYFQHSAAQGQNNCARKIKISVSNDKSTWTVVKNGGNDFFYLGTTRNRQTFYLPEMVKFRYYKVDMIAPQPKSGQQPSDEEGQKEPVSMGEIGVGTLE